MTAKDEQLLVREHKEWLEKQRIFISGRIWNDLYPKVGPGLFLEEIRKHIDLSQYGEGIEKYYFTFIAIEKIPPNFLGWLGSNYNPKHKKVEIAIELPYQKVVEADKEEVIKLMEAAFLKGIDEIADFNLVASFDYEAFKEDVTNIFAQEGWYKTYLGE